MAIIDTLNALIECVCTALRADRAEVEDNWVGECCIQFGREVAFDSCCENGGMAWVTASGGYPSMPSPSLTPSPSTKDWGEDCSAHRNTMRVEVGAIRCVCFDQCNCDAKERNASLVYQDFEAAMRGIVCCFENDPLCGGKGWSMTGWEIVGPDGGCGGFKIHLLVEQPLPCCPIGG